MTMKYNVTLIKMAKINRKYGVTFRPIEEVDDEISIAVCPLLHLCRLIYITEVGVMANDVNRLLNFLMNIFEDTECV